MTYVPFSPATAAGFPEDKPATSPAIPFSPAFSKAGVKSIPRLAAFSLIFSIAAVKSVCQSGELKSIALIAS